jgi:hypothetical protein
MRTLCAFFCHRRTRRTLAILITLAMPLMAAAETISSAQNVSLTAGRATEGRAKMPPATLAPLHCLPEHMTMTIVAQNVTLCCCPEPATGRRCCNYVRGTTCPEHVPGCGC